MADEIRLGNDERRKMVEKAGDRIRKTLREQKNWLKTRDPQDRDTMKMGVATYSSGFGERQ
jgi:hypothetical protein